jgi:hypothetical protein
MEECRKVAVILGCESMVEVVAAAGLAKPGWIPEAEAAVEEIVC